jgi:hypothetical protein
MKMSRLEDIIGAIDKTTIACSPPADVVQKYVCFTAEFDEVLDVLQDHWNYRDDISSYNSLDDKFNMCVYPPRNLCKETKLNTEIVKLDMSAVEKVILDKVFGASHERLLDYLTIAELNLNKLRSLFHAIAKHTYPHVTYHVTEYFQRVYMLFLDKVIVWLHSSCALQVGWELPLGLEIHNNEDPDLISELSDDPEVEGTCSKTTELQTLFGYADIVVRSKPLPNVEWDDVRCLFQLKRPFGLLYRRAFPWQVDQLQCELLGLRDLSNSECVCCCLTDLFALVCGWQRHRELDGPLIQFITEPLTNCREYLLILALLLSDKVNFSCLSDCTLANDSVNDNINAETNPASILGKGSADPPAGQSTRKRRGDEMDLKIRKHAREERQFERLSDIKTSTADWYHQIHFPSKYRSYYSLNEDLLCLHNRLCNQSGNTTISQLFL